MHNSIKKKIENRIRTANTEAVFGIPDFLDIDDYETVRKSLFRFEKEGFLRRILPGVYDRPQYSELLKEYIAPSMHQIAFALARNYNWTIAPSGETALNQLGLSTQVAAKWSYISDGPYRTYVIGNSQIEYKHRNNKEISGMSYKTAMVIQALKALGKERIDDAIIQKLRMQLTDEEKSFLQKESQQTTVWIYSAIKRICE